MPGSNAHNVDCASLRWPELSIETTWTGISNLIAKTNMAYGRSPGTGLYIPMYVYGCAFTHTN